MDFLLEMDEADWTFGLIFVMLPSQRPEKNFYLPYLPNINST